MENNASSSAAKNYLADAANAFFVHLASVVLPFIMGGAGVCVVWSFFVFKLQYATGAQFWGALFLSAGITFAGAACGFLLASVSTLKSIVGLVEKVCSSVLDSVQDNMRAHVSGMDKGITRSQMEILLSSSLSEVKKTYRDTRAHGLAKAVLILILSISTWLTGRVLLGRLKEMSGMELTLGVLFANKFVIAAAVFFNLRLLLTLLQIFWCVIAVLILALPFIL